MANRKQRSFTAILYADLLRARFAETWKEPGNGFPQQERRLGMEGSLKPNTDPDISEMEKEIQEIVSAPIVRSVNGLLEGETYLANSWLWAIHSYVRKRQGDTLFSDRPGGEKRQRLAGIANRLELDFEELLEAEPHEEARLIYEALLECERTGYKHPG